MIPQDNNYNAWHTAHLNDNDLSSPWHNFVKKELVLSDVEDKVVLEIGCGRGGFSNYIMEQYPNAGLLFACDFSISALEIAKSKSLNLERIVWQREDIQKLSFRENTFDTVISCETIEHIPSPLIALREIHRVLKPGGKFILTCPNYFNLFGIWCLYRKMIGKPYTEGGQPYVNYILIPSIYTRLKLLGFSIEHFHSAELVLPGRVPKTFYPYQVPGLLRYFGNRTFYTMLKKRKVFQ